MIFATACQSEEKKIKDAAYNYSYAMANYDIDGAEPYADDATKQTTLTTGRGLLQMVDTNYIKSDTPATITIEKVEMLSDSSAVATYHKVTPIKNFRDTVEVRKYGRQWLVHTPTRVVEHQLPPEVEAQLNAQENTPDAQ